MLNEVQLLLHVQGLDEAIPEFTAHLERLRVHRQQLEHKIELECAQVRSVEVRLHELDLGSRAKNLEVDNLDMNIRNYQQRLDKGIISFKEMEDLRTKIELERERINRLEDEALELMDGIEAARTGLDDARSNLSQRERALHAQVAETDVEIEATQRRMATLTDERAAAAAAVPQYLVAQYDALRTKFSNPIALLDHGTCAGCKLRVSGNTAERVRGGMGIVTCEHCSRILYLSSV